MKKLYEKYLIDGIEAKISPASITFKPKAGWKTPGRFDFVFRGSKPATVEQVANAFLQAVAVSKSQNPDDFIDPKDE